MHSFVLVKESTHSFSPRILSIIGVSSVQSSCTPGLVHLYLERKSAVANIAVWQKVSKDFPCSSHHFLASKREISVVWQHKCNQDISWICDSSSHSQLLIYIFCFLDCEQKNNSLSPNPSYWLGIPWPPAGFLASCIQCYERFLEFSTKTLLK